MIFLDVSQNWNFLVPTIKFSMQLQQYDPQGVHIHLVIIHIAVLLRCYVKWRPYICRLFDIHGDTSFHLISKFAGFCKSKIADFDFSFV